MKELTRDQRWILPMINTWVSNWSIFESLFVNMLIIVSYSIARNYNEIKMLLSEVSTVIKLWPYEYLPPVNINVISKNIWHKQRFCINNTSWKMFKYGVFSGLCFPVFTSNTGKYGPEKTSYLETFHAMCNLWFL